MLSFSASSISDPQLAYQGLCPSGRGLEEMTQCPTYTMLVQKSLELVQRGPLILGLHHVPVDYRSVGFRSFEEMHNAVDTQKNSYNRFEHPCASVSVFYDTFHEKTFPYFQAFFFSYFYILTAFCFFQALPPYSTLICLTTFVLNCTTPPKAVPHKPFLCNSFPHHWPRDRMRVQSNKSHLL